jgi:hypothetical protein
MKKFQSLKEKERFLFDGDDDEEIARLRADPEWEEIEDDGSSDFRADAGPEGTYVAGVSGRLRKVAKPDSRRENPGKLTWISSTSDSNHLAWLRHSQALRWEVASYHHQSQSQSQRRNLVDLGKSGLSPTRTPLQKSREAEGDRRKARPRPMSNEPLKLLPPVRQVAGPVGFLRSGMPRIQRRKRAKAVRMRRARRMLVVERMANFECFSNVETLILE